MKSIIYQIVSILAVGLYFIPMLIVIGKKLWPAVPFRLFALYWLVCAMVNLIEFIPLPYYVMELYTVIYNLLDIPLVLTIIYFSTSSDAIKKFTRIVAPALLAAGLVNCIIRGFTTDVLEYVLGGELLIVIGVIVWEIILKLQQIKLTGHAKGLLLIYAALFFEYGTFVVIYIFDYFLPGTSTSADNFLVYYLSSLVALPIALCGFLTRGIKTPPPVADRVENQFSRNIPDYVQL
ncbi:hypothetical protein FAM09_27095 [Niastella caeni]|uniref:Histidine kinase N-terminal 7TM region domain-containing protein n=1 Tax=Niastella caeni TaxID=2569763 RepID=A0A4S8HI81_9BACT|nr:hypothetical protein [Niastella caeni]THU32462.1 hypothetical protein FAM09_27095 [Niastella caeni]